MSNELNGHETALMATICQEFRRRRGAEENESFIIDNFLDENFQGGGPHGFMRESLDRLVNKNFFAQDGQTVSLTQPGIDHCTNNVG